MATYFARLFQNNTNNTHYESLNSIEAGPVESKEYVILEKNIPIPDHSKRQFELINSNKEYKNDLSKCIFGCYKPYYASDIIIDANCMINRHLNGVEPITNQNDIQNLLVLRDRITHVFDHN